MKKMRRLIPAIAMLLVSAVMLSTASFAWFTISTEAEAVGMSVKAMASSSLLITDNTDNWLSATGSVNLTSHNLATALTPATHDNTFGNGLKTVAAPDKVNPSTGAYDAANGWANTTSGTHFVDYVVYIGTTGAAMENYILNAEVSVAQLKYALHNAVTVDFLVNDNYGGSINLKQAAASASATANGTYNIDIAKNLNIPVAVLVNEETGVSTITGSHVKVTMRVYFYGALLDENGECYVQNTSATLQTIGFAVNFTAGTTASTTTNTNTYDPTAQQG